MNTELRDCGSLKRHPLHKAKVAAPDKHSADWAAFVETVRADGRIRDAVKITPDGLVMDGWWRVLAARDLQLGEVPCEINDPNEAALLIVESLTARKQMTRGATVYLALGMLQEYTDAAERRRLGNVAKGRKTNEQNVDAKAVLSPLASTRQEGSIRYLAEWFGCDHETVRKAKEVRAFLHDPKNLGAWLRDHDVEVESVEQTQEQLRAEFEPLLFNGEKSLWKILQAAGGRLSTEGMPKVEKQLELFEGRFNEFIATAIRLPDLNSARDGMDERFAMMDIESLGKIAALGEQILRAAEARLKQLKKGHHAAA